MEAAATVTQEQNKFPWSIPLHETFNILLEFSSIETNKSIFSQPIFELLSITAKNISRNDPASSDMDVIHYVGRDLLQVEKNDSYEIMLNGKRFTFELQKNIDGHFNEDTLREFVKKYEDSENPPPHVEEARKLLKINSHERQVVEQLYIFLTTNSCKINSQHFLLILLGIQQSISSQIMNIFKELSFKNINEKDENILSTVFTHVDKLTFNIQCDPTRKLLTIQSSISFHFTLNTNYGKVDVKFPFDLTNIEYVLNLSDIESENPGLKIENGPIGELLMMYDFLYNIILTVPNVVLKSGEINHDIFFDAFKKKVKYKSEVEQRMAARLARGNFMGGKRQKKIRIRVSKKRFHWHKTHRKNKSRRRKN